MTFATTAGSNTSTEGSNVTAHTASWPASIAVGDRLGAQFTNHGTATVTDDDGDLSEIDTVSVDDGSADNCRTTYFEKVEADGTEGTTNDFTTSAAERSTHITARFEDSDSSQAAEATTSSGTGNNPDTPSLTPSWGSADTKWLTCMGHHFNDAGAITAPTDYAIVETIQGTGSSNFDTTSGVAERDLATGTEDPGAWSISGLDVWVGITVAIPPVLVTNTPIDMDAGSLSFSGQSNTVTRSLLANMDAGSLGLTGLNLTATKTVPVSMDLGSLTFTGLGLTITRDLIVAMNAGSLSFTGQDADVTRSIPVNMDLGALTLAGLDPTVTRALLVSMDAGSVTLTGRDATVVFSETVDMNTGSLTFTGLDAIFTKSTKPSPVMTVHPLLGIKPHQRRLRAYTPRGKHRTGDAFDQMRED